MRVNRIFIDKVNGKSFQFRKTYKTELNVKLDDNEEFIQIFAFKKGCDNPLLLFESPFYKIEKIKIFVN